MALKLEQVNITYRNGVKALDNVSFEIGTGLYGLLGSNGAGKSTLMRTIATLQLPDSGNVSFRNINALTHPVEIRKRLGYLPQDFGVYPKISAEDLLHYFALLKGISSGKERRTIIQHVLELTNLYESRKRYVESYSGGMKQRFGIAQMLLGNPELIIVDEPTSGLDPEERSRFIYIIRELSREKTVIFSTHIVNDIKGICHGVMRMEEGRMKMYITKPNEAHILF